MIVGEFFDGDDDTEIAWKQHEVYHSALGILIETCNDLTRFAKSLLHDADHEEWGQIGRCDHRTLQGAHDLLAAAWRFRHDFRQAELPLAKMPEPSVPPTPENIWLWWLRDEIESWVRCPALVRSVQLILTNQNQPTGYVAESALCLGIMDKFPDVPWKANWRAAYEKDRANDSEAVAGPDRAPEPSPKTISMACECTARGLAPCNQIPCHTTIARAAREGWGPLE